MTTPAGWGRIAVEGDSMLPVLRAGDRCIVQWCSSAAIGDVVVARRPDRPELLVVKRVTAFRDGGAWLEGDNVRGSHDSWLFGAVGEQDVLGVVRWRYWPRPGRIR